MRILKVFLLKLLLLSSVFGKHSDKGEKKGVIKIALSVKLPCPIFVRPVHTKTTLCKSTNHRRARSDSSVQERNLSVINDVVLSETQWPNSG